MVDYNILVSKRKQILLQKPVLLEDDRGRVRQTDRNGLESSSSCCQNNLPFLLKVLLGMYYCYYFHDLVENQQLLLLCCNTQWEDRWHRRKSYARRSYLLNYDRTHFLPYTLHRHLAVDQGASAREPCGQAGLDTAQHWNPQLKATRTGKISTVLFYPLPVCSPLQIKPTNKILIRSFQEAGQALQYRMFWRGRQNLPAAFLCAYEARPEEPTG